MHTTPWERGRWRRPGREAGCLLFAWLRGTAQPSGTAGGALLPLLYRSFTDAARDKCVTWKKENVKKEIFGWAFIVQSRSSNYHWLEEKLAPHLTRVRAGTATSAPQHRSRTHFWSNLPAALICAAKGAYGQPKNISLDDAQMADTHTLQMDALGMHRVWPVQSATVEIHNVQTSNSSHQPCLRCRFIPSYILFTTEYVAACTSWWLSRISEWPELQMQEQHLIPPQDVIFQDWRSKLTILCHLHDCGLESAEHS